MNIQLTPVVEPSLYVIAIVLGVGVTLISGLLPAVSASRVAPMEALRPSLGETVQRIGRVSTVIGAVLIFSAAVGLLTGTFALVALGGLLLLVGLVLVAPALVKPVAKLLSALVAPIFARDGTGELAQGNLTRQPSRAAITASTTMIGLAIVVGVGGMLFSLVGTAMDMFDKSMGSDYLLLPPSVADMERRRRRQPDPQGQAGFDSWRQRRQFVAVRSVVGSVGFTDNWYRRRIALGHGHRSRRLR